MSRIKVRIPVSKVDLTFLMPTIFVRDSADKV